LWKGETPPFANVGVIRISNFTKEGTLDYSGITYLDVETAKLEKRRLQYGDIILEKSGGGPKQPVGRVALFDRQAGDFSFSNFTASLRVLAPDELDFRFLHGFLHWSYLSGITEAIQSHSTGIRNLNADAYKAIEISYPPLPEQHRIVSILDEGFAAIATARADADQNLRDAREVFVSHLQSVFAEAWTACQLVTLADLATDITDGDHMPPPKSQEGVPFITIGNIVKETRRIDFADTFMVPRAYFEALKANKKPRPGDVLYTVTGSFGIPVIVDEGVEFCFQRHIGLIRPRPDINSMWLYYLLLSPQVFKQANEGATGAAQRTVSLGLLRSFEVPRLARTKQEAIVAELNAIFAETERLASIYERKLAALDALKRSLLHQAFTGAL
jgi:type I restriction enzyme S subunit